MQNIHSILRLLFLPEKLFLSTCVLILHNFIFYDNIKGRISSAKGGVFMQSFTYQCPTKIIFGRGAEDKVAEELRAFGARSILLVYGGSSAQKSGLLPKIERQLTESGIMFQVIGGVKPNPRLSLVREGVRTAISAHSDFILAIGGGSVIDTAKAIAHGAANPDTDVWDFWTGRKPLTKSMPIGSVLTLSAAGSETSDSAVITDEENQRKLGLNTPFNRPALAFMNPELTYTVPKKQLTAGACDILMHTLERYFTGVKATNLLTDRVAESLIKTVMESLAVAVKNQQDYDAMSEIMWAGSVSHTNFTELGRTKDFSCHRLGHELSAMFDATHGETLTAVWPSWAKYVYQDDPARFAHFAKAVFGLMGGSDKELAEKGIAALTDFFRSVDMPVNIPELLGRPLTQSEIETLADRGTAGDTKKLGNFHPLGKKEAIDIYTLANS